MWWGWTGTGGGTGFLFVVNEANSKLEHLVLLGTFPDINVTIDEGFLSPMAAAPPLDAGKLEVNRHCTS